MLESKDHSQIQYSGGVWDLTFALLICGQVDSEYQNPLHQHAGQGDKGKIDP
jgi:hypothetical protein